MPLVLPPYKLRFGTQVPVGSTSGESTEDGSKLDL